MRRGIRLGSFGGAPIVGDASVFVLTLLFAVALLIDLDALDTPATTQSRGLAALAGGVGLVMGVLVHELSHAGVAMRRSMIVGEVRVFVFGGYSVITGEPSPKDETAIAVAGPIASLLVAGIMSLGTLVAGSGSVIGRTMWLLALANAAIAVFNLLPGFPLDGARVLRGILTARTGDRLRATRIVNMIGRVTGWLTVGLGVALLVMRQPVGLFVVVGGWFLAQAAAVAGRREEFSVALDGMIVSDVMRRTSDAIPADWTISAMLDRHGLGPRLGVHPVEVKGRVVGVVGQEDIEAVSPPRWSSTRVRAVMSLIGPADVVQASDPLEGLLLRPAGRSGVVVVIDGDRVVGIVDDESLGAIL